MGEQKNSWWTSMIKKHGSEEAVREFMRQNAAKSSRNTQGTGYFATLSKENPELFKQLSRKGGQGGKSRGARKNTAEVRKGTL